MTLSTVLAFARAQCQTDSNGLTDANGIIFANEALQDLHRELVTHGVDASQLQECYRDATAGIGTYLYPTDMLALKVIELNYTSTNSNDYVPASQCSINNLPAGTSFSWLRNNANKITPQFDDHGDWYEIFPTPQASDNLTSLIRLVYFLQPTLYTSTSDTVVYPENMDASLLGWRVAASYLYSLKDASSMAQADKFLVNYANRIKQYVATLSRGSQQPLQATPLQMTGFEF